MTHDPGETANTNTDLFELSSGVKTWMAQYSGPLKSVRLPTGLLHLFGLTSAPVAPPVGWFQFAIVNGDLEVINSSGTNILTGGTSAFLGLSDTPASYSGQALKLCRVNAAATALEFTATGDITHHSYPFGHRSETTIADPASPQFGDRETVLHYPGWTLSRNSGIGQGVPGFYTFDFAEELDATALVRTSYCEVGPNVEEGDAIVLDLRMAIPEGFTGWGANGIVIRHRLFSGPGAGSPLDTARIDLDVFDPAAALDTVAANVNRSKGSDVADDVGYVDLQLTQAQLGGITNPHGPGDILHIRITCFGLFGLGGAWMPGFRLGRLSAYFA